LAGECVDAGVVHGFFDKSGVSSFKFSVSAL
jgi:hypothetical protein